MESVNRDPNQRGQFRGGERRHDGEIGDDDDNRQW